MLSTGGRGLLALVLALLLAGCLGDTPQRARILAIDVVREHDRVVLQVEQQVQLSKTMLQAMQHGIALQFVHVVEGCEGTGGWQRAHPFVLRYAALRGVYELDNGVEVRRFSRRSALLAALDRRQLPLGRLPEACQGGLRLALNLTALPTPLRFPAFLQPAEWRLVSPVMRWQLGSD